MSEPVAATAPEAPSLKSKPVPPVQILVENPDGEFVLGEDPSRAPVVRDQGGNQQPSAYDVERETMRAEREADRRGLMGMVIRRRRAAAFMLCLDVMYMFLTATLYIRDGALSPKEIVTLVLLVVTALVDFACVLWLVSTNASVGVFTLVSCGQIVCMSWTVGLLPRGSTAFLVVIRVCALLQMLRARAAVVELTRLDDLPHRLPATPTVCERVHYLFVGRALPWYSGPRRESRAPRGARARTATAPPAQPAELASVVAHNTPPAGDQTAEGRRDAGESAVDAEDGSRAVAAGDASAAVPAVQS